MRPALCSIEAYRWTNARINAVHQPEQAAAPEAVQAGLVAAIQRGVTELGYAATDETALEETDLAQ